MTIRKTTTCIFILFLLTVVDAGLGIPADGPFVLRAEDNLLTLRATDIPLKEVLEEIVNQVGIQIVIHGQMEGVLTADFSDMPLEEGLKRLIRDFDYVFIYDAGQGKRGDPPLSEVIIYAAEGESPDRRRAPRVVVLQTERLQALKGASLESLVRALEDEDPEVREEAVDLLAESKDEMAVLYLAEVLLNDEDEDVRESAAMALEDLGDQRAIGSLIRALRDPEAEVRESAVDALSEIGGEEVTGPLMDVLGDEDEDVREAAATALKELTGKDFGF